MQACTQSLPSLFVFLVHTRVSRRRPPGSWRRHAFDLLRQSTTILLIRVTGSFPSLYFFSNRAEQSVFSGSTRLRGRRGWISGGARRKVLSAAAGGDQCVSRCRERIEGRTGGQRRRGLAGFCCSVWEREHACVRNAQGPEQFYPGAKL